MKIFDGWRSAILCGMFVVLASVMPGKILHAQHLPQFTQFTELKSYVNPAATAANEVLRIGLAGRYQWLGLEDQLGQAIGPQSYMGYADIPIVAINSGIGFLGMVDRNAYEETIFLRFNAAHHLKAGRQGVLSIGLSFDYMMKTFDFGNLPSGPPSFGGTPLDIERASGFDLGAGVYYSHESGHFIGFSAHNLLETPLSFSGFNFGFDRQFYIMAGSVVPLIESRTTTLALLPAFLVHSTMALVPQYTAQATMLINERYFAGLAYRYEDAVGGIVGVILGNLRIGLSYDYTTSVLRDAGSLGSPEITLSWGKPSVTKMRWPARCYP